MLVGVITRSTLTALLATLLFWFATFSIHTTDGVLSENMFRFEETAIRAENRLTELWAERDAAAAEGNTKEAEDAEHWMQGLQKEAATARAAVDELAPWETTMGIIRTVMPETDRTLGLLHRALERNSDVSLLDLMTGRAFEDDDEPPREMSERETAQLKVVELENEVPAWRTIGKSLIFEAIVLALALWIFRRRDY